MHNSVLLTEAVLALNVQSEGLYVDATFGRGGHSREILKLLGPHGHLIVVDQDPEAINYAEEHFGQDARVQIVEGNFVSLKELLKPASASGLLFDLGVSSPQLDNAARGFSFLQTGPLDMRMNPNAGQSCAEVLATLDEKKLTEIIKTYGEEKFAKQIARAIVKAREVKPLKTTQELAELIKQTIPKRFHETHKHPATRTFQALRIYVNHELEALSTVLEDFPQLLKVGGRAVFISFHSLEDRLVKQKLQALTKTKATARRLPIRAKEEDLPCFKLYIKMQKASANEVADNPRARSATLRVVERIR
jgi:16S rRNA (cytosine1402-N4)-methyltransferase